MLPCTSILNLKKKQTGSKMSGLVTFDPDDLKTLVFSPHKL